MTEEEKAELKRTVHEEIESLKREIKNLEKSTKPIAPDNAIGRLTRMDAIQAKSINEAILAKSRNRLSRLETALEKMDGEEYGICSVCAEPIPPARLRLMPEADRCVRCVGDLR